MRRRFGMSMVEMLVVIAIIGVVMALLVPAIQKIRESADRTACANNLKQIGLAFHQHHTMYKMFPSNGGWDGQQTIKAVNGGATYVYTIDRFTGQKFYWGVGEPYRQPADQPGSWAYAILPFIEQESIYKDRTWWLPVALYFCPSRRGPLAFAPLNDQYGTYSGGGWTWAALDYAANAYVVPNRPLIVSMTNIFDGTSTTILAGEKAMNPVDYLRPSWYWDEPYFLGGSGGTQRGKGPIAGDGTQVLRDSPDMGLAYRYNWGSRHPSGAEFVFLDGSVRTVPYGINPTLLKALMTPDGGEPVADF